VATIVESESRQAAAVGTPQSPHRIHGRWYALFVMALAAAILASLCASVSIGAAAVPFDDVLRVLGHHIIGSAVAAPSDPVVDQIVWELRAPRALLALLVGGGLAVAGCVLQAVVRNPLADPYVLGAVSGASLGAVAVIVLGSATLGGLGLSSAAFAGAMVSLAAVFALGRHAGRFSSTRLVLAGARWDPHGRHRGSVLPVLDVPQQQSGGNRLTRVALSGVSSTSAARRSCAAPI
jgi:iron complex transport system permease protein